MEKYLIKGKMPYPLTERTDKSLEKGEECEMSVLEPGKCSWNLHHIQ